MTMSSQCAKLFRISSWVAASASCRLSSVASENTTPQPNVSYGRFRSKTRTRCAGSAFFISRAKYNPAGPPPTQTMFIWGLYAHSPTRPSARPSNPKRCGIVLHHDGRVVGEALVAVDLGAAHGRREIGRQQLIVDSPSVVPFEGVLEVRPPAELFGFGVHRTETVDPAQLVDDPVQPRAFVREKTGDLAASHGVIYVDFPVRDVEVAANNIRTSRLSKPRELGQEAFHEGLLHDLPDRTHCARGHVKRNDAQRAVIELQPPSLPIVFGPAQTAHDTIRFAFGIDGDAAIAFSFRVQKDRRIMRDCGRLQRQLMLLRLGFLQTHEVRIDALHPCVKALAGRRPYPVAVERDDLQSRLRTIIRPSPIGSSEPSTRSSRPIFAFSSRNAAVSASVTPASATSPPHRTLSMAIRPLRRINC